ncbi:hypothetical protein ACFL59_13060 [Planctomycetota bacterium]
MTVHASLYIPEMHSFCDRWCERCTMTKRCKSCALDLDDDDANRATRNEQLWSAVAEKLPDALRLIEAAASEQRSASAPLLDVPSDLPCQTAATAQHLLDAAHNYALAVYGWLAGHSAFAAERRPPASPTCQQSDVLECSEAHAFSISDALEVVSWYGGMIAAKIAGGTWCRDDVDSGFIKIALLGMDRSLGAWAFLREALPDEADTILSLLADLDRLRHQTERAFPLAWAFRRPGFDDG